MHTSRPARAIWSAGICLTLVMGASAAAPAYELAFVSHRDGHANIYVVNDDGSKLRRLIASDGEDTSPAWSPDGERLLFISDRDGDQRQRAAPHGAVSGTSGAAGGPGIPARRVGSDA